MIGAAAFGAERALATKVLLIHFVVEHELPLVASNTPSTATSRQTELGIGLAGRTQRHVPLG